MTLYEILGVAKDASAADIKKAFRKLASENHPDREGGSDETMAEVNKAYDILSSPDKRAYYDASGMVGEPPNIIQQAESLLMAMFAKCVSGYASDAIVFQVTQGLEVESGMFRKHIEQIESQKAMFLARRNKIKSSDDKNLAHMVVDQHIQGMNQSIAQKTEQIAIYMKALEIIKNYEDA
jgi:DnaJ-class molecular chaperone